ncbi:hypothetical protein SUGI_1133010 [Cryptomeria japonica]|nr:hypothetical protein SUGI_1133010 [Cryptomeria japonica]
MVNPHTVLHRHTVGTFVQRMDMHGVLSPYGKKIPPPSIKPTPSSHQQCNGVLGSSLMLSTKAFVVSLDVEADEEVSHNVLVFSELGLIGRFRGLWPSLHDLHAWISDKWEPLIDGCVQIYPAAKGFFTVIFEKSQDRNKVLYDQFWSWEDKFPLMLKPWHPAFCPTTEVFDKIPIWVRLPNLPLHLWFDSYLEAI